MNIISTVILTYSLLKIIDLPLFVLCVVYKRLITKFFNQKEKIALRHIDVTM